MQDSKVMNLIYFLDFKLSPSFEYCV